MVTLPQSARAQRGSRALSLTLATLAQAGMTYVHQGVVVIGIFFVAAYHLTLAQMGLVVSFVSLGWMCSSVFTGILVDRFGAKIVLIYGTVLMSIAAGLISFTSTLVLICALLFVIGLGVSSVSLGGSITVMTAWSPEERGLPMGIRQMGVPVGSMVAALSLPTLAALVGLRSLFLIFALELLILGMSFAWTLPRMPPRQGPAVRAAGGLRGDLKRVIVPCGAGFLLAWGQYVLLTFTIPMLHTIGGVSVALAGVVLAMAQVGGGIARIGLGALADRLHGRHDLVLVATSATATALAVLVAVLPMRLPFFVLIALWFVMGIAMVGWNALLITWSGERVRNGNTGAAMGFATSFVLLGAIVTAPVIGLVIQTTGKYADAWLLLAAILFVATLVVWFGSRHERRVAGRAAKAALQID